jgi:hypothetical protein
MQGNILNWKRNEVEAYSAEQRRIFDRGYLATLQESKMRLTDDPIAEIKSNSIITQSGEEVYVDAIVRIILYQTPETRKILTNIRHQ